MARAAEKWEPSTDGWLSGFADGEAHFGIRTTGEGRFAPHFAIALRADDVPVLRLLCETFGGSLHFERRVEGKRGSCYRWIVGGKREMARLVAYFDRFPLRAKKARDYAIWREAVRIYCERGGRAEELDGLREALVAGRGYDAGDEPVPATPITQLQIAT